jgi:iron(III) transport system ATP-binding protein
MKKAAYLSFYSAIHATIKQKRNKNKSGASLGLEGGIQMDDHGIIELYWARNEQAIHETAAMYGRYCSTIARNIVKNSEDTEECVNDTYLRVWNSIPTDRPRIFKAYIGRITRNIALSLYRKTHAEKRGGGELELVFEELEGLISTRLGTEEILENVKYGLRFHGLKDKEARIKSREYLELVRLEEHANKRISALSGGQQQRVALARSLVLGPKVLLLDEPLSNLDALLRVQMRDEISRLQKLLGITTIFVTHDQEEAFALADRILLMNNGELVQEGRPEELYENPNSAFSLGFIGESSLLSQNPVTFIRPQRVEIGTSGQAATILQRFFRGDRILYVAEADGQKILVEKLNRPDIRQHEEGENVFLQFEAEALKGN